MELTLEQTLSTILQQLAEFFGTTTEVILANAPEWLAKYGWYHTLSDFGWCFFVGAIISIVVMMGIGAYNECSMDEIKITFKRFISIIIICQIISITIHILPCIVAPEFVGLDALLLKMK